MSHNRTRSFSLCPSAPRFYQQLNNVHSRDKRSFASSPSLLARAKTSFVSITQRVVVCRGRTNRTTQEESRECAPERHKNHTNITLCQDLILVVGCFAPVVHHHRCG
mmetsp:Transcript_15788/g.43587  ORF Transcript_15788/g.43587 Transcript_15788/m.43587 type:complete len:107 (-) Transcript_15788:365-685(-)